MQYQAETKRRERRQKKLRRKRIEASLNSAAPEKQAFPQGSGQHLCVLPFNWLLNIFGQSQQYCFLTRTLLMKEQVGFIPFISFILQKVKGAVRRKMFYLILILFRSTFHMKKNSVLTKPILTMFQRYLGFCNMQMRCLMTSSTPHRSNKLPQMRNISSNNCAHWNVPFVLAQLQSFSKIYHYFRRYSSFTKLVEQMTP